MTATSLWELAERARKRLSEIAKGNRDRALLAMADLLECPLGRGPEGQPGRPGGGGKNGASQGQAGPAGPKGEGPQDPHGGPEADRPPPRPPGADRGPGQTAERPEGGQDAGAPGPHRLHLRGEARGHGGGGLRGPEGGERHAPQGGKEAFRSNRALVALWHEALGEAGLPEEAVTLVPTTDREAVLEMCRLELLDLLIPRGGEELIRLVQREARVPVLAHAKGVNHLYVDKKADLSMALRLALNGKTQRPAVSQRHSDRPGAREGGGGLPPQAGKGHAGKRGGAQGLP